jgi:hypothetical protein
MKDLAGGFILRGLLHVIELSPPLCVGLAAVEANHFDGRWPSLPLLTHLIGCIDEVREGERVPV